ncbi:MAG: ATP-binding protein [Bacteroidia bacterium]|nr:ATP-binding protein [Bacteroidia bacterium]
MAQAFIGRKKELEILQKTLYSEEPEMVAVIGRRRVGKTFLVRTAFAGQLDFEITGTQNASTREQLKNFAIRIREFFGEDALSTTPGNWMDAFEVLMRQLDRKQTKGKWVVFLDELPWLASHKSGFLNAFSFFWNSWATQKNIVIVICGSAASWMIQKVVYHKGGLHNRITKRIDLQPFNLCETEAFLRARNLTFDRYQLLLLYMAMGGIPHYLKEIEGGKSAAQNIDALCFSNSGLLRDEFSKLYPALFEHADNHIAVIRALSQKWKGMSRTEILATTQLPDGGGLSNVLEELVGSGFINAYYPFGKKKKDMLYRLTDEYSLFYLKFIETNRTSGKSVWMSLSQTQEFKSWSGYAFESICIKHLPQIEKALSIAGVFSEASGFIHRGNADFPGLQIDLVLDRKDHVINLFEMKFYHEPWLLSKSEAMELRSRVSLFKNLTQTSKQVFLTTVTPFGLRKNEHSIGLVDSEATMDDLFAAI